MLDRSEQANVGFVFYGAHYWIIDRMSRLDYNDANHYCIEIKEGSQHIVLNRFYFSDFYAGIIVRGRSKEPFTSDITIQNSRFDPMSPEGIDGDAVAILLMGHTWNTPGRVLNTHILNNEMRNCNDGIMLIKMPQFVGNGTYWVDYPGTVIDYNHIYVDTTVYTDGNGNHDPNGLWALTENAVDLKGGSDDPANPVVVSNNYFWGYRRTDQHGGGSGSWGTALAAHYHTKNLVIKDNVIFNSNRAIAFSGLEGTPLTAEDVTISKNIFYDIGYATSGNTGYNIIILDAEDVSFEANTIVDRGKHAYWLEIGGYDGAVPKFVNVSCNVVINSAKEVGTRGPYNEVHDNFFYNTEMYYSGDGIYYNKVSDAKMGDLTFVTDLYTNSPDTITLPGVVTTQESPHYTSCFSSSIGKPCGPNPPDLSENVRTDIFLQWLPTYGAEVYDVYFGTTNPPSFYSSLKANTFKPGVLEGTTTYYWQVVARNDSDTLAGPVWQFHTVTTGLELTNLALHKPVTCSSQENEAHGPQNLVDSIVGVDENRWSASPMPQWAEVDLGRNDTLMRTEVVCFLDRAYRYTVTCREEGDTAYKMLVDRSDNSQRGTVDSPITDTFSKTLGRYVRLTVLSADTTTYDGTWASISEFRVFGKEGVLGTYTPSLPGTPGFYVRNYPNPFSGSTQIVFHLPEPGEITVKIYNSSGQEISTLVQRKFSAGTHTATWNPALHKEENLPEGLYFYQIRYDQSVYTGKMMLIR
jgi:hypothetical protein